MDREGATRLVQACVANAERQLESIGTHPHTAFFVVGKNVAVICLDEEMEAVTAAEQRGDSKTAGRLKDEMADWMRSYASEIGADGLIQIFEAWLAVPHEDGVEELAGGDEPGMRRMPLLIEPRLSPHRRRALMAAYEFRLDDGSRLEGGDVFLFTTENEGKVRLRRDGRLSGGGWGGRFFGLMP